jgi:hydroxymethylpyrimidine pyrophosphatase-like HAD family hydrolase
MRSPAPVIMTEERHPNTWLLVSDVDETLYGDDEALAQLAEAVARCGSLLVALNSSRPLASVRRTVAGSAFAPHLVALIGAMGTEVEIAGEPAPAWRASLPDWDRAPVDELMAGLGFAPHGEEVQTPLKASFHVPRSAWPRVEAALAEAGVEALVVGSGETDLDVLPPGAGKGPATAWLARELSVPRERLVVAGDSANDAGLFAVAGHGIAVGNAREELLRILPRAAYRARACHAAGVLEGLTELGVLAREDAP